MTIAASPAGADRTCRAPVDGAAPRLSSTRGLDRPVTRLAILVVLCALSTACSTHESTAHVRDSDQLVSALGQLKVPRRIGPRISIPIEFRPCSPRTPEGGTIPRMDCDAPSEEATPSPAVMELAARASAAVQRAASPEALHAAALVDLLWGSASGKTLRRSISYLQMTSRTAEHPAPSLVDLAAAHLVLAERTQDPRELLEALEASARALEIEPRNAAARYDLALALDRLELRGQAEKAWTAVLELDSTSGWAEEARVRARALAISSHLSPPPTIESSEADVASFAARDPQGARELGWNVVLGKWGDAVLRGDSTAGELLAFAGTLGTALERQGCDGTLADAVLAIRARADDRAATRALAHAHVEYAAGQSEYSAAHYADAGRHFERALRGSVERTPLHEWAMLFRGATLVYGGRREAGERMLREVAARADTARHPSLAARANWSLGTTLARRGLAERALAAYTTAARLYARAGDREKRGAVQALAMEAELGLGRTRAAYETMHRALQTLQPYRASVWLHDLLYIASLGAARDGMTRAAMQLQDEGVAVASRTGRPMDRAEAQLARAVLLVTTGADSAAARDIHAARSAIDTLRPGDQKGWYAADLHFAEAMRSLSTDPASSAAALDSVVAYFEKPPNPVRLLPALVTRARARVLEGDIRRATADLDSTAALLDEARVAISTAPLRASMLDAAHEVFDRLVMLLVDTGQPEEALRRLEMARTSLASIGASREQTVAGPSRTRRGEVALDYALIGDTLLIWTAEGSALELTRTTVERALLIRTIERVRAAAELRAGDAALRAPLAALYGWLIRPVESRLGKVGTRLVLIADGPIAEVPFAALLDSAHSRYLIEGHPLRFALSLRDAARARPADRGGRASVLLVANPAFDPSVYPGLAPLEGAGSEVDSIAAAYDDTSVLAGATATRGTLEAALPRVDILHFAGHAIFDDERPDRSQLVLAPAPGESGERGTGALTAADITQLDLRRLRLVVLSACQTVRSPGGHSGGLEGLTGAFLVAGARGVVGSEWRVDDALTSKLMLEFYRAYRQADDGSMALHAAQLRLLRSRDPELRSPAAWAAFRYVGN